MMATLVLKNVPEDLYKALKVVAERNHRSLNAQAIAYLASCTGHRPISVDERLYRAATIRAQVAAAPISDDELVEIYKMDRR